MFTLHTDGSCPELSNCFIFTRSIAESHGLIVLNLRIVEFFFTRRISESHGLFTRVFFLSRICEFANFSSHGLSRRVTDLLSRICELSIFYSHGMSRMVTAFLSRDLSFGPTDQREVICELSIFYSHGMSRMVAEVMRVEL